MKRKKYDGVALPLCAAMCAGLALRFFVFDVFRVEGASMEPSLPAGSIVLVNRAAYGLRSPWSGLYLMRWGLPREKEIVVYSDPWDGSFKIKRCAAVSGHGAFLRGDNAPASVDSRLYGSIPVEKIGGKVLFSFHGFDAF